MSKALTRLKTIVSWLFVILVMLAHPVESKESVKEIEEVEEVKLYFKSEQRAHQKPKTKNAPDLFFPKEDQTPIASQAQPIIGLPRYILYSNMIFYL